MVNTTPPGRAVRRSGASGSGQVECFVPADPLPARVGDRPWAGFVSADESAGPSDRRVRAPPAPWRRAPFRSGATDPAPGRRSGRSRRRRSSRSVRRTARNNPGSARRSCRLSPLVRPQPASSRGGRQLRFGGGMRRSADTRKRARSLCTIAMLSPFLPPRTSLTRLGVPRIGTISARVSPCWSTKWRIRFALLGGRRRHLRSSYAATRRACASNRAISPGSSEVPELINEGARTSELGVAIDQDDGCVHHTVSASILTYSA